MPLSHAACPSPALGSGQPAHAQMGGMRLRTRGRWRAGWVGPGKSGSRLWSLRAWRGAIQGHIVTEGVVTRGGPGAKPQKIRKRRCVGFKPVLVRSLVAAEQAMIAAGKREFTGRL